jgi:hypothetical protein
MRCIALGVPAFLLHQLQAEIMTQSPDDPTLPLKVSVDEAKICDLSQVAASGLYSLHSAESRVRDSSNLLMHLFFVPLFKGMQVNCYHRIKECVSQPFQAYQSLTSAHVHYQSTHFRDQSCSDFLSRLQVSSRSSSRSPHRKQTTSCLKIISLFVCDEYTSTLI